MKHGGHKKISFGSVAAWMSVLLMVLLHGVVLADGALSKFPNVDEIAHLPAGVSHWKFQRFDLYRVNPPLVRSVAALPVCRSLDYDWKFYTELPGRRPEFSIGRDRLNSRILDIQLDFRFPRLVLVLFQCLCAVVCFALVKSEFGILSGCVFYLFWCASPDVLAHGQTIGPDTIACLLVFFSSFAMARFSREPTAQRAFVCGVVIGVALLSKLTCLMLIPALPVVCCLTWFISGCPRDYRRLGRLAWGVGLAVFVSLVILNAGYLFDGTGTPLGSYRFCSAALRGEGLDAYGLGSRFSGRWLGEIPVLLPRDYVLGIDYLKFEVEHKMWSFLAGEWRLGSWWYYYVFTTLLKTPLPALLGAMCGLGYAVYRWRSGRLHLGVKVWLVSLSIPVMFIFVSVSYQGGFNHHHRYVMAINPIFFLLISVLALPDNNRISRLRLASVGLFGSAMLFSTVSVAPYYLSFFNSVAGGPENGWRYLGFSNIDWGQDILEVDKWLKAHPERRPLVMDIGYFGMNGELFDVPTLLPPRLPKGASVDEVRRTLAEPQWWIISVRQLYNLPGQDGLEYLQQLEPVERIAYAYHVYRIDPLP
jgi:hypothetical protein